jgi:hypothetical protein
MRKIFSSFVKIRGGNISNVTHQCLSYLRKHLLRCLLVTKNAIDSRILIGWLAVYYQ